MSDPVKTPPPPHLVGEMRRAWEKAVHAQSRLGKGRLRRPVKYLHKPSGTIFYIGESKWKKPHDKWQRRFARACERLKPYDCWKTVEALDP